MQFTEILFVLRSWWCKWQKIIICRGNGLQRTEHILKFYRALYETSFRLHISPAMGYITHLAWNLLDCTFVDKIHAAQPNLTHVSVCNLSYKRICRDASATWDDMNMIRNIFKDWTKTDVNMARTLKQHAIVFFWRMINTIHIMHKKYLYGFYLLYLFIYLLGRLGGLCTHV